MFFILSCITVDEGQIVLASGGSDTDKIKKLSSTNKLICPICKQKVIFRSGKIYVHHFSHLSKCSYTGSQEPESAEHLLGKQFLYEKLIQWDSAQNVELEKFFPEYNFRPDIYFEFNGKKYAIEYQCYPIQEEDYAYRSMKYIKAGFVVLWIFGKKKKPFSMIQRVNPNIFTINNELDGFYFYSRAYDLPSDFESIETFILRAETLLYKQGQALIKEYRQMFKEGKIKHLTNKTDFSDQTYKRLRKYINMDVRLPVRISIRNNGCRFFQALTSMTYDKRYDLSVCDIFEAVKIKAFLIYLNFRTIEIDHPLLWDLDRRNMIV